jgi:hypothetical protein
VQFIGVVDDPVTVDSEGNTAVVKSCVWGYDE